MLRSLVDDIPGAWNFSQRDLPCCLRSVDLPLVGSVSVQLGDLCSELMKGQSVQGKRVSVLHAA